MHFHSISFYTILKHAFPSFFANFHIEKCPVDLVLHTLMSWTEHIFSLVCFTSQTCWKNFKIFVSNQSFAFNEMLYSLFLLPIFFQSGAFCFFWADGKSGRSLWGPSEAPFVHSKTTFGIVFIPFFQVLRGGAAKLTHIENRVGLTSNVWKVVRKTVQ